VVKEALHAKRSDVGKNSTCELMGETPSWNAMSKRKLSGCWEISV